MLLSARSEVESHRGSVSRVLERVSREEGARRRAVTLVPFVKSVLLVSTKYSAAERVLVSGLVVLGVFSLT